ncbi:hypothetical protein GCM10017744_000990 [Streptomyces antimycoticus]
MVSMAWGRTGVCGVPAVLGWGGRRVFHGGGRRALTLWMAGGRYGLNTPGPHGADGIARSGDSSCDAPS